MHDFTVKGAYSGKVAPLKSPVYIVSIVVEIFGFVSSPVGSGQKGPWKWPYREKKYVLIKMDLKIRFFGIFILF